LRERYGYGARDRRTIKGIDDVVRQAFQDEATAELVVLIRASPNYLPELSLVAVDGDTVVGHVMLHHLELQDGARHHQVVSLSPLAVRPESQRQGIGAALVEAAVERTDQAGEPLIVLEGSPAYYPRFGFQPAARFGVAIHLPSWAPPEAAMVRPLRAYRADVRGTVVYPPAFDRVNQDR
jgi:putative acetyltransferase